MLPNQPTPFAPIKRTSLAELNESHTRQLVNDRTRKLFEGQTDLWSERARQAIALDIPEKAGEAAAMAVGFARLAASVEV